MKSYINKLTGFALVLLVLNTGCKKFVDMSSPTIVSTGQYYKTQADITSAVNGMYSGLRNYYEFFYVVSEMASDNTQSNGYTIPLAPIDNMVWVPSNSHITQNWTLAYANIARANIILDRIDAVEMADALRTQYKGEAKFIRALMYFNLVQFFGNIQLVLHEIKSEEEAYSFAQVRPQDVYNQVISDLRDAIGALPATYPSNQKGKATKGAAQGLLGKVYVTNKQFNEALPVLNDVITTGGYELLTNYANVFAVTNKNNKEIVFDVQYLANGFGEGSNFSLLFAPFGSAEAVTSGGTPGGNHEGTLDLHNAFETGDLRRDVASFYYPTAAVYYTRKFLDKPKAKDEGNNHWPVLRYADILLLYAEALNEADRTDDAFAPLNQVRVRAGLSELSDLTKEEFHDAVHKERRIELCFEGDRWFQLLRTGTMFQVMTDYKAKYLTSGGYRVVDYVVTPNKVLFPIPFSEVSLNTNLVQNEGY